MRTKLRSKVTLLFMTCAVLLAIPAIALADIVANNLDATVDNTAEVMGLQVGGANGTSKLYVINQNTSQGDTNNACNLAGASNLQLDVTSSNPSVATVSPASVTINDCTDADNGVTLTVSPVAAGSTTISVARKAGTTSSAPGTFDFAPATFTVNVTPPPNTPPQVQVTGVTGGFSYNKGSVPTAMCSVTDLEDGPSTFPATLGPITGPNANDGIGSQEASCSYTDQGPGPGLTATASVFYNIVDPSGPVITKVVTPEDPDGDNDWYKSNVTVVWTVSDPQSPNSIVKTGCVDQNITTDQPETTYTCSATSAGGSAPEQSVTIKRDGTAPTIDGTRSPGPNANGWNNESVTVSYSCADNLSGVASCGSADLLDTEGANQSATGSATDAAGNTADATVSGINIDLTKPVINASAKTQPGGADYSAGTWTNKNVEVSFSCSDELSDVDTSNVAGDTKSESGANQSVTNTGDCTDKAGNTADPATFSDIDIDKDLPTITHTRTPAANADGWNNANVTVHFECTDQPLLSGIASCTPDQTVSNEAANQSVTGTATDGADNSASDTVSGISIDKTKPTVSVTGVSNGATYTLGSVPTAGCSTSDGLSGVKDNATLTTTGGPVGSVTAKCDGASDKAGNTNSASVTYNVNYNWSGFFSPVDNLPTLNLVKGGSSVPMKFSLGGNQGMGILMSGYPKSISIPCDSTAELDALETVATAGSSGLNFDSTTNQYNYIWKTDKAWTSGCRQVEVKLIDGTSHRANFKFSK